MHHTGDCAGFWRGCHSVRDVQTEVETSAPGGRPFTTPLSDPGLQRMSSSSCSQHVHELLRADVSNTRLKREKEMKGKSRSKFGDMSPNAAHTNRGSLILVTGRGYCTSMAL